MLENSSDYHISSEGRCYDLCTRRFAGKKSVTLKFSVHVCADIILSDIRPEVDNWRFSLCAENVDEIKGGSRRYFIDAEVKKLEGVVVTSKRRGHALLG